MQWQKELYHHEELPPPHVWEEMKKTLVEEPYQVRQSLYMHSENPPAELWDKVFTQIAQPASTQPARIINFRRKALSYAAAIVGLGIFISVIVFMTNNNEQTLGVKDLAAGISMDDSQQISDPDTNNQLAMENPVPEPEKSSTIEKEAAKEPKPAIEDPLPVTQSSMAIAKKPSYTTKTESIIEDPASISYSDGNYIHVYSTDGEDNRISYKLAGMVASLNQKGQQGKPESSATKRWNKVLQEWTEKMGQSSFIPSGTNFFDIAEMARMLETDTPTHLR